MDAPRTARSLLCLLLAVEVFLSGGSAASEWPIVHLHRAAIDTRTHPQRYATVAPWDPLSICFM